VCLCAYQRRARTVPSAEDGIVLNRACTQPVLTHDSSASVAGTAPQRQTGSSPAAASDRSQPAPASDRIRPAQKRQTRSNPPQRPAGSKTPPATVWPGHTGHPRCSQCPTASSFSGCGVTASTRRSPGCPLADAAANRRPHPSWRRVTRAAGSGAAAAAASAAGATVRGAPVGGRVCGGACEWAELPAAAVARACQRSPARGRDL